ncbi:HpsJ family protein [Cyanobium gracile UHCC 0139]|uniref:HpsJ family protein n=1 Tax=Cyanobium gracile UHCC 0139 TaxID=3110308 RepID=A0ABU5RUH6_9CYAN|nr:HpsJ family protein [Cyanobium gracile]MEA5391442.1 HpsJ family protein [Cyanobium gracile UHCC 0139]
MTASPDSTLPASPYLSRLLATLSLVLLVVFVAAVGTVAVPPRLLDPTWQLALIAAIITNASLALIGTLLLPLALGFHPINERLRARWHAFRRWALPAALGFLLLIPLQGYAAWKLQRTVTAALDQQTTRTSKQFFELRQAINSATTHEELQTRLRQLFGRNAGLSPAERKMPMAELRTMLQARAEQASNRLMQQIEAQAATKPKLPLKETIRIAISALAYGIGFAFLAGILPRTQVPVVGNRGVDQDYFETLAE